MAYHGPVDGGNRPCLPRSTVENVLRAASMRRILASLSLALPLAAAAQMLPAPATAPASSTLAYGVPREAGNDAGVIMPLWRAADGRMLALVSTTSGQADQGSPEFRAVDASSLFASGLVYDVTPRVRTHITLSGHSWQAGAAVSDDAGCTPSGDLGCVTGTLVSPLRMVNGEIGATFRGEHYSVDVAVSKSQSMSPTLPRVVPNVGAATAGVPLTLIGGRTDFSARGRLALGHRTGIDLGASVGRIRLLPGNVLGVSGLGQKSLSFGVDRGPISGHIVGRLVQPENAANGLLNADHSWTSVDLGITVRLPWQGELSFGAQNLWSSGLLKTAPNATQPDQSRIPYVQYHQDL